MQTEAAGPYPNYGGVISELKTLMNEAQKEDPGISNEIRQRKYTEKIHAVFDDRGLTPLLATKRSRATLLEIPEGSSGHKRTVDIEVKAFDLAFLIKKWEKLESKSERLIVIDNNQHTAHFILPSKTEMPTELYVNIRKKGGNGSGTEVIAQQIKAHAFSEEEALNLKLAITQVAEMVRSSNMRQDIPKVTSEAISSGSTSPQQKPHLPFAIPSKGKSQRPASTRPTRVTKTKETQKSVIASEQERRSLRKSGKHQKALFEKAKEEVHEQKEEHRSRIKQEDKSPPKKT
jgi:hypothetical protein